MTLPLNPYSNVPFKYEITDEGFVLRYVLDQNDTGLFPSSVREFKCNVLDLSGVLSLSVN